MPTDKPLSAMSDEELKDEEVRRSVGPINTATYLLWCEVRAELSRRERRSAPSTTYGAASPLAPQEASDGR